MSFGYQVLGFGSSAASREIVLDVTSNVNSVNVLTLATAAGYNASTDTTPIVVNIASGVSVFNSSGTGAVALTTGALNAASPLTINVASGATVRGQVGATGSTGSTGRPGGTGGTGGTGGDAIKFEISSGTGTYVVNNEGTVSGGGGGGGGGGGAGAAGRTYTPQIDKGVFSCVNPSVSGSNGSAGSAGSAGGVGQNGSAGSSGSAGSYGPYPECAGPPSGNYPSWATGAGGPGGPGGTAGKAVNKGGLTVTTGGGGTYNGATS
jgi:hypothetical protein